MARTQASGSRAASGSFASPMKAMSIPLNDDKAEKAQRLQSRQKQHAHRVDQLKAAATPNSKNRRNDGGNLSTPMQDDDEDIAGIRQATPVSRIVPVLANFEAWIQMATNNKINAANSWNFALIDYFHDMSLLKEGDGVNFAKASTTLEGCVKIYTSRVDSVATETGKLLSGLAESGNKKRRGASADDEADEDGDGDEDGLDSSQRKGRKKAQRSEANIVASFDQLKLKKMELEFSVDPLFKKASADFDEGGAKGLLLNHLSIDSTGRIVFDSSDDVKDDDDTRRDSMEPEGQSTQQTTPEPVLDDGPVDIAGLGMRFFPNLDILDEQDICPTLKTFELGGGDGSTDLPFLKAPENWRDEHPEPTITARISQQTGADLGEDDMPLGMDDGDAGVDDSNAAPDVGFGEGGERWARDAALVPQMRPFDHGFGADPSDDAGEEVGVLDTDAKSYGVTLQHRPEFDHENILNYFDNAMQKNWAGPEHWKITRLKEANKPQPQRTRKEKEPFEIDFEAPMSQDLANLLYTPAANNSTISMPRSQWQSKTQNLLPDDKHFNSKDLLKLFLKPKAMYGVRRGAQPRHQPQPQAFDGEVDENYWAAQNSDPDVDAARPSYDPDFFQDDALPMAGALEDDSDVFADAQEGFPPGIDVMGAPQGIANGDFTARPNTQDSNATGDAFGANLIAQARRLRPEYVKYARVAKKVDVRRLKEEIWRGIGFDESATSPEATPRKNTDETLKFTNIMNDLQHVYPVQQMNDISTSFGFICLLHLANEKGLVIENVDGLEDLTVRKDFEALDLDAGD